MSQPVDYKAVLAELRAKRAKIEAAIQAIQELDDSVSASGSVAGEFKAKGLSIPDAARAYLERMKRPQTAAEIARALKKGGFTTKSNSFPNTVRSSLIRALEAKAGFRRVGKKWALEELQTTHVA
jgi:propanediol dehydratase large subunit